MIFFLVVIGLVVGSFLNVCIYRMPREESIVKPRSHCPHCNHTIVWYDNIPVLSYILLCAKCRHCKERISVRYPIVELLNAVLYLILFFHFGLSGHLLVSMAISSILIACSLIDLEHFIIPDSFTVYGTVAGLIITPVFPVLIAPKTFFEVKMLNNFVNSLLGCVAGAGILFLMNEFSKLIFKQEGMGGGDMKLMAMIGAFYGIWVTVLGILLGCVIGSVAGIIIILVRTTKGEKYTAFSQIPFGPYLAVSSFILILKGEDIIRFVKIYYFG